MLELYTAASSGPQVGIAENRSPLHFAGDAARVLPELPGNNAAISLEPAASRPLDDEPLFVELLEEKGSGVVTIALPNHGGQCLPVFSTPFRAFDYVQTLLASGPSLRYLSSSPPQLIQMLHDIEAIGIKTLALDRCPRCSVFTNVGTSSLSRSSMRSEKVFC